MRLQKVLGIASLRSTPALLESTSIVLASGLDLFQTRVMPSGGFDVLPDSFNKLQLVLTIMGLTAGIVVTRVRCVAGSRHGRSLGRGRADLVSPSPLLAAADRRKAQAASKVVLEPTPPFC